LKGRKNRIGKCVLPHGPSCSSLYCFSGLTILMFSYKVVMLAPECAVSLLNDTYPDDQHPSFSIEMPVVSAERL
jgi:hypothetical protein